MLNFTKAVVKHMQKYMNELKDLNAEEERVVTDLKFVMETRKKVNDILGIFEAEEELLNKRVHFNKQKKLVWSKLLAVVEFARELDAEEEMKQMIETIMKGRGI